MKGRVKRDDVIKRLRDIAFGRANDIVKLAFLDGEESFERLDGLDLTMLSEVRRAANGVVELKLTSRVEVLKLLLAELDGENGQDLQARSFFEAMDRAAQPDGGADDAT